MVQAHERGFLSSATGWQPKSLVARFFFDVSAELKAHGGQNFGREIILAARREPLEQRRRQHRGGSSRFDGGENGPAPFAGVGDAAGKAFESWLIEKRNSSQVEKPRCDYAAAAPDFRNICEVEIILIVLRIAQGSGFCVGVAMGFAGVGVLENVQALRVGRHQTVLDAVVNHLDEMAGAGGAAVKIALFGCATYFVASGSARNVATAGR